MVDIPFESTVDRTGGRDVQGLGGVGSPAVVFETSSARLPSRPASDDRETRDRGRSVLGIGNSAKL